MKTSLYGGAARATYTAALVACAASPLFAQTTSPNAAKPAAGTLEVVTITGNPLGATDLIAPTATYAGTDLLLRSQNTLGATLEASPGVSSSYFGPNASRPIIRGLEGDRLRILQNSGASIDASALSHDHAVAADPISMERIEVLRGPGALMYGGNAVGGVVNVIDNRIAREPLFDNEGGVSGRAVVGVGSGNNESVGGVLLETGTDRFALHADVFNRSSGDVAVPVSLACTKAGSPATANQMCNSAAQTRGGALGGTVFFEQGRLGASASSYRSDYGTVAEDAVTIGMQSDRYAVEGDMDIASGWLKNIKARVSQTDYQHTEFEAGAPGTVFKNTGNELRLEARHQPMGALQGVVGVQRDAGEFSADGAEAFAPYSRTGQTALFALEELRTDWGRLSFGARMESVQVDSMGNPQVARFVPTSLRFNPRSYAVGALWDTAPGWQLTSNLAYSERAPKDYELFADGPHIATHAYEVGNVNAALEQSTNLDIGAKWKSGANRFGVSAFMNQFANYISQEATGINRDTDGNGGAGVGVTDDGTGKSVESGSTADILPEYTTRQVGARFTGLEVNTNLRLLNVGSTLDLELRGDLVRATNTTTNQPLPRIAPERLGMSLVWGQGPWGARLDANHYRAQNEVPTGQLPSGAYTLLNAGLTFHQRAASTNLLWFAKVENMGDVLAYSASSILTQTAPGKAPLPGRTYKLGLQVAF